MEKVNLADILLKGFCYKIANIYLDIDSIYRLIDFTINQLQNQIDDLNFRNQNTKKAGQHLNEINEEYQQLKNLFEQTSEKHKLLEMKMTMKQKQIELNLKEAHENELNEL